jgi:hypothetical protein
MAGQQHFQQAGLDIQAMMMVMMMGLSYHLLPHLHQPSLHHQRSSMVASGLQLLKKSLGMHPSTSSQCTIPTLDLLWWQIA